MEIKIKSGDLSLEQVEVFTDQMSEYFNTDFIVSVEARQGNIEVTMDDSR